MKSQREITREYLAAFYLEWVNNWLTPEAMAEGYSITKEECLAFITAGRAVHNARVNSTVEVHQ